MTSSPPREIAAVYLNGAFFTGLAIDSRILLTKGYTEAQKQVRGALPIPGEWQYAKVGEDQPGMRFSVQGKYESLVPLTFMSRIGDGTTARFDKLLKSGQTALDGRAQAAWTRLGVRLVRVEIDLFDLGVGVIGITLQLSPAERVTLAELRSEIELISVALVAPANGLVFETVAAFRDAVESTLDPSYVTSPWFQNEGELTDATQPGTRSTALTRTVSLPARLLWLHRTYVFRLWDPTLEPHFDALLPSASERYVHRQLLLIAGIGSSVIHLRSAASEEEEEAGLVRLRDLLAVMDLQWAYIAAIMEIDRVLLRRLSQLTLLDSTASSTMLESESRSLLELSDRVGLFRATVDSIIIDLGGGTRGLWDAIARVQTIPEILVSVDDKLAALRAACDVRLAEAAGRRQRRLALTVDIFAGFSVMASVAQVISFESGDREPGIALRVTVLALTAALVILALLLNRYARRAGSE